MRPVLDEATEPRLSGVPTDPLGSVASSSTDGAPCEPPASVLIYCNGVLRTAFQPLDRWLCSCCGADLTHLVVS